MRYLSLIVYCANPSVALVLGTIVTCKRVNIEKSKVGLYNFISGRYGFAASRNMKLPLILFSLLAPNALNTSVSQHCLLLIVQNHPGNNFFAALSFHRETEMGVYLEQGVGVFE